MAGVSGSRVAISGSEKSSAAPSLATGLRRASGAAGSATGSRASVIATAVDPAGAARAVTTRSARAATKSSSWVTATTPWPSSRSPASRSTSSIQVRRSWPKVGSSSTSRRGAVASAVATLSRRASPPERVYGLACASFVSRSRSSRSSTERLGRPAPGQGQLVDHPGGDELVLRVLEHRADPPGQLGRPPPVRRPRGRRSAVTRAGGRPQQAAEQQRQGGLAGAVRAGHRQDLAGPRCPDRPVVSRW